MKPFLYLSAFLLLALTALVVRVEFFSTQTRLFSGRLDDAVPRAVIGWQSKDLPLAESTAGIQSVRGVLNYDQVVQRLFVKGDIQIIVYVAYWEPGRVSLVDAGSHNPDSCWVYAGCERLERDYAQPGKIGARNLLPYEHGLYRTPAGGQIHAMFWHLVNGEPNRYDEQEIGWRNGLVGRIERTTLVIKDFKERGIEQRREQMFVRLSSNKSPRELLANPDAQFLLSQLGKLGIYGDEHWK